MVYNTANQAVLTTVSGLYLTTSVLLPTCVGQAQSAEVVADLGSNIQDCSSLQSISGHA